MSTNTKNLKLIKQEEHEYYNLNVINENLDKIDSAIEDNLTSPDLLNEDITQFIVGTGTVEGINKDYTEDMCQSVVTLDNIKGKTVKNGTFMNSIELNNIYRVINENTTVNLLRGNPTPLVFAYDHQSSGCYLYDAIHDYNSSQRVAYLDLVDVKPNTTYCIKNFTNNLSLNMVGHMYDENYCKSDEDKGWGENTDTRFLTTNSTTKKMCVYIRKQDDTELTQNEIDSLKIMVVEGNTEPMEYVESGYESEHYNFGDMTLRSLPNGICDEIKEGNLIQRTRYLDTSNKLGYSFFEFTTLTNNGTTYGRLTIDLNDAYIDSADKLICNVVETIDYTRDSSQWTAPTKNSVYVNFSPNKYRIAFILSGVTSKESALNAIQNSNPRKLIFNKANYVVKPFNLAILANTENKIKIQTPVPLSCTHKVSLNTKSQIEELQEVVKKEKKSVWKKIKELTDYKFNFDSNGYFKFPNFLGGIIIQWGNVELTGENSRSYLAWLPYPIAFPNNCLMINGSINSQDSNTNSRTVNGYIERNNRTQYKIRLMGLGIPHESTIENTSVNWIAIGY